MTQFFVTDGAIGIDLYQVSPKPLFALGSKVQTSHGGEFVYVKAAAAITKNYTVAIDTDFAAEHVTAALAGPGRELGVAIGAAIPLNYYGWVMQRGTLDDSDEGSYVFFLASAAATTSSILTWTSSTPGVLTTGATNPGSQVQLDGIRLVNAIGGSNAAGFCQVSGLATFNN